MTPKTNLREIVDALRILQSELDRAKEQAAFAAEIRSGNVNATAPPRTPRGLGLRTDTGTVRLDQPLRIRLTPSMPWVDIGEGGGVEIDNA